MGHKREIAQYSRTSIRAYPIRAYSPVGHGFWVHPTSVRREKGIPLQSPIVHTPGVKTVGHTYTGSGWSYAPQNYFSQIERANKMLNRAQLFEMRLILPPSSQQWVGSRAQREWDRRPMKAARELEFDAH